MHAPHLQTNGQDGFAEIPARPIFNELVRQDNGERLQHALNNGQGPMIRNGLTGLLYPDIAHLTQRHHDSVDIDIREKSEGMQFHLLAPRALLEQTDQERFSRAGTSIAAGLAYAPKQYSHTREMIQAVLRMSDIVHEDLKADEIAIVFQGGARISDAEYQFAKEVGAEIARFEHAPKKLITGGGRGIMRAPLSGARAVGKEKDVDDTNYCGISCGKIIAAEPPNSIVKNLAVFEQIERRLEAFTRSGQLTVFFPGGTGTFEELLYVIAVQLEAKNRDIHYNYVLAGSEENREYYDTILRTLERALGREMLEQSGIQGKICIGTPETVAKHILTEAQISQGHRRQELSKKEGDPNVRMDFRGDVHIPSGLREPFNITREKVAALALHREQSLADAVIALRRFLYTVTCACISTEREEVAKNGPFEIFGDPQITNAMDHQMQYFARSGRMNGGEYVQPYVLRQKMPRPLS